MRSLALAMATGLAALPAAQTLAQQAPLLGLDLATDAGVAAVGGAWRYHDTRVIDVDFRGPGPDRKPSGPPNRTQDLDLHAGAADFDDSEWELIAPSGLAERRSTGRVCFAWYRFAFTVPEQVDGRRLLGTRIELSVVVDDYAEVWVDGTLARQIGQRGGTVVAGFNAANRVVVAEQARPGQRVQVAVFAMNGPVSASPENFIWVRSAQLEFFPPTPARGFERLTPEFDALFGPEASVETIADGHAWVEGPVWHPDGYLLFTDIPANAVFHWQPGAPSRPYLAPAGWSGREPYAGREPGANGLALDDNGHLLSCEHGDRRVTRLQADFTKTVVAARYGGKRLNSPNDVIVARDGTVLFTDPPFGLPDTFEDPRRELHFCGVYRVHRDGRVTLLTDELAAPNGLALSPDERTLYVSNADPARPVWWAFPAAADGSLGEGRVLFDATPHAGVRPGGADGIKVDAAGRLFTAGPGGIYVITPEGRHLGTVLTGSATSNCCFGEDGRSLFITAGHSVLRVRLSTPGAAAAASR